MNEKNKPQFWLTTMRGLAGERPETDHHCTSISELVRMGPEQAYRRATGCPHCMEILDFLVRNRRMQELRLWAQEHSQVETPYTQQRVFDVIDRLDLLQKNVFYDDFRRVIDATLPALPSGSIVQVVSEKELLDPYDAHALHEIVSAIRRGIHFQYLVGTPGADELPQDARVLLGLLRNALGQQEAKKMVSVASPDDKLELGMKDVIYRRPDSQPERLVELVYAKGDPREVARLWLMIPTDRYERLVRELQS